MYEIINLIVKSVEELGYIGIYLLMFLESTFIPFPSEVVIIPAGYLASQGQMNIYLVIFYGVFGSLSGALLNYFLALKLGRVLMLKYQKYLFLNEKKIEKFEKFFNKHGPISTFIGRLIPVVRQYISFPAGIAKMDLLLFSFFTSLGALIWVTILAYVGYIAGENQEFIKTYTENILFYIILLILFVISIYFVILRKNKKDNND